ncbi:hypothetical protein [Lactiplantibacillus plajomi]|uniref:Uncharacterized protein n=1 Tax=Lactiplantibacillus plajomi TaxID=1457217 RepID=A0ABV6K3N1_9LACO|nr:hypothetical protein [Lactiplantibacillus plajomi]
MEDWHNRQIEAAIETNPLIFNQPVATNDSRLAFVPRLYGAAPRQTAARIRRLNNPARQ